LSRSSWPKIARGPQGYTGSATVLRRYLRHVRPARGRVYQEVHYEPAQAMQVDGGECGRVQVGSTMRKVSVFVAVLCYSRLLFIDFTLSQRKAEFYRGLVNALTFFGGSPRNLIVDNAGTGHAGSSLATRRTARPYNLCGTSRRLAAISVAKVSNWRVNTAPGDRAGHVERRVATMIEQEAAAASVKPPYTQLRREHGP
jgi:transposase